MVLHAALGASSASRWMACPGSVQLSEGRADRPSVHALYGTAAHALSEWCLSTGCDPEQYTAPDIEGVEIDDDMVWIVDTYRREVLERSRGARWAVIEAKFSLASLNPPAPMFGTADFVCQREDGTLVVVDLKAGQGVRVRAEGNLQLRYYALGAYLTITPEQRALVKQIEMVIVQPRAGGVSEETVGVLDLLDVAGALLAAAHETLKPGAKLAAGEHCRWCRARGACPEQQRFAVASAQNVFDDGVDFDMDARAKPPGLLDDGELARALERVSTVEQWASSVMAEAMSRVSMGRAVPGWKLVAKRARREWQNEEEAEDALRAMTPSGTQLYTSKLLSPAQAEKHLPRDKRGALSPLIVTASGGPVLARDDDPRPAIPTGDPFAGDPLD